MAEVNDLQPVDANNETRKDALWVEGMPRDQVNDSARSNEGIESRWHRDWAGQLESSGSGGAYAVVLNRQFTTLPNDLRLSFKANHTSTGPATLQILAPLPIGTFPLRTNSGNDLSANSVQVGTIVDAIYKASDGFFRLVSDLPVSAGSIGPNELADEAVETRHYADQPAGSVFTYGVNSRPAFVQGVDGQILLKEGGAWVAKNLPVDETFSFTLSPLVSEATATLDMSADLSRVPDIVTGWYVCLSNDSSYSAGDRVPWAEATGTVPFNPNVSSQVYPTGIRTTVDGTNLTYYVCPNILLPPKADGAVFSPAPGFSPQLINLSAWSIEIEARNYLITGGAPGGVGITSAYTNISDGSNVATAAGEDTILFKSTDGTVAATVSGADKSVDLSVQGGPGAPATSTYVTSTNETADLPNSALFSNVADSWLTGKSTADLAPSAPSRLYVTQAEKDQWNAAQPNAVTSVFGLTGAVQINQLTQKASPDPTDQIAIQSGGSHFYAPASAFGVGTGITNAYVTATGDTGTATAVAGDNLKIRAASSKVVTVATDNDPTHGDNVSIDVVEANLNIGSMGGNITDGTHGSLSGGGLHASANGTTAGFMSAQLFTDTTNHIVSTANPHSVTKTQVGLGNVPDIKVNTNATTDPSATDDSNQGYGIQSKWTNINTGVEYTCVDPSANGAEWVSTTFRNAYGTISGDTGTATANGFANLKIRAEDSSITTICRNDVQDPTNGDNVAIKVNPENLGFPRRNQTANADPTATDDSGQGYSIQSKWTNVTTSEEWTCISAAVGAAVWKLTTAAGGGAGNPAGPNGSVQINNGGVFGGTDALNVDVTTTPDTVALGGPFKGGGQLISRSIAEVQETVSGTLPAGDYSNCVLVTSGNVTIPTTKGWFAVIRGGGAHTITFDSVVQRTLSDGDYVTALVVDDSPATLVLADRPPKNNLTATAYPTTSNDLSQGYSIGSRWIFGFQAFTCMDASSGSAVWRRDTNARVLEDVTGTARINEVDDDYKQLFFTNAAAKTFTLDTGINFGQRRIEFFNEGAGDLTIVAGTGMTVNQSTGLVFKQGDAGVVSFKTSSNCFLTGGGSA